MIQTPENINNPRVDFNQVDFDALLNQKGRNIIWEKSLICPCKEKVTGAALSTCKNCGGTGWLFVSPKQIKLLVHSLNIKNDYSAWSEEARGTISCSSADINDITVMDKITMLEATSYFNEILLTRKQNNESFSFLTYIPKTVVYLAAFISDNTPLTQLTLGTDYNIVKNKIILLNEFNIEDLKLSVRYSHSPIYHVLDMNRESMESYRKTGNFEVNQQMPFSFMAKRAHYIISYQNQSSDLLLQNIF